MDMGLFCSSSVCLNFLFQEGLTKANTVFVLFYSYLYFKTYCMLIINLHTIFKLKKQYILDKLMQLDFFFKKSLRLSLIQRLICKAKFFCVIDSYWNDMENKIEKTRHNLWMNMANSKRLNERSLFLRRDRSSSDERCCWPLPCTGSQHASG